MREVGAAAIGGGNGVEFVRSASDAFGRGLTLGIHWRDFSGIPGRRVGEVSEIAAERDGKNVHVRRFQPFQEAGEFAGRRCVDASGEKHDGFFAGNAGEPVERSGKAGGEVELAEADIEAQLIESAGGDLFVGDEIEDRLGVLVIASDSDAVGRSETIEQDFDGLQVAFLQEIDGRAGFYEEQNLGGFIDAEKISEGLLGTVVEEQKVSALKAGEELAARVGDGNADVDALDAHTDAGRLWGWGTLCKKSAATEKQSERNGERTTTQVQHVFHGGRSIVERWRKSQKPCRAGSFHRPNRASECCELTKGVRALSGSPWDWQSDWR